MMRTTHDHGEIKKWAEKYQGSPELIDHPDARADTTGIRINFPGHVDDMLFSEASPPQKISWEEFFKIFDERGLAMEYSDGKALTDPSFAYKFFNRE